MTKKKAKNKGKSLSRKLAEHPIITLSLFGIASGGLGATGGALGQNLTYQDEKRATQQQILDLKNELHKKDVELLNTQSALDLQTLHSSYNASECGTGDTLQITAETQTIE